MTHIKWDVVNLTHMLKSKIIITMMENNYFFIKNTYKTLNKEDVLVILKLLQETKNSNLLDKNCKNVNCHIQHEESWLRWIVIEQVNNYK